MFFGLIKGDFLSSLKRTFLSEVSECVLSCPEDKIYIYIYKIVVQLVCEIVTEVLHHGQ
jgi:hypothetical protein